MKATGICNTGRGLPLCSNFSSLSAAALYFKRKAVSFGLWMVFFSTSATIALTCPAYTK